MSFTCEINKRKDSEQHKLKLDILGTPEYGLDKTIVNAIRRTLLSSIETYAFRTEYDNTDIIIEKNNTSLHNEFILDRIGLIPLYLNTSDIIDNPLKYLFVLNVKHDNKEAISIITAGNFDIYELKETVYKSADYENGMITTIDKDNYDMTKKVSDEIKKQIFKPFQDKYYSIIIELKSTNSEDNVQELVLYGSPSVSIAKEDARWQAVSCATYSYKTDQELLKKTIENNIIIKDIPSDRKEKFKQEFIIREAQRYYHRDYLGEPYWYNFDIEGQHFLNNKQLFIKANEIIIESLRNFEEELDNLIDEEKESLLQLIFNKGEKSNVINLLVEMQHVIKHNEIYHGFDDTLGSIIQAHISNKLINDESALNLCGYKRTHPLENRIMFTLSLNGSSETEEKDKTSAIVDTFKKCCDELIEIFGEIIKVSSGI